MSDSRLILLPVDGSEHSDRACDWYLTHLYTTNQVLGFCHICDTSHTVFRVPYSADQPEATVENVVKASWSQVDALIEKYITKCKDHDPEVKYKVFIENAKPFGEEILKVAERENATAIVLGHRGLGAIKRAIFGSVSDHIIRHSHIPVIITPPVERDNA